MSQVGSPLTAAGYGRAKDRQIELINSTRYCKELRGLYDLPLDNYLDNYLLIYYLSTQSPSLNPPLTTRVKRCLTTSIDSIDHKIIH